MSAKYLGFWTPFHLFLYGMALMKYVESTQHPFLCVYLKPKPHPLPCGHHLWMALSLAKTMVVPSRDLHDPGLEEDGHGDAAAPGLVAGGVGGLAAVGPPVVRPVEHQHQLRLGVLAVRRLR